MANELGRRLPHDIPRWVDPQNEVYFITINCLSRGIAQLTNGDRPERLLASVATYQQRGLWFAHVFLLMPDHLHALLSFPYSGKSLSQVVRDWKKWSSRELKIRWQADFFEHRLRKNESATQKLDYICANPVRAGLVRNAEDWLHAFRGGGTSLIQRG